MPNQPDLVFYSPVIARLLLALHRGPEFPTRLRWLRVLERALGPRRFEVAGRFGERYAVASEDLVQRHLLLFAAFEPEVVDAYVARLSAEDTLLDIGANVGATCLGVAKRSGCRVLAIEADPLTARILRHNTERSGLTAQVHVEAVAVGGVAGRRPFTRAGAGNVGRSGFDGVDGAAEVIEVPVLSVDELIAARDQRPPRVWKVDVEGAELEVFEGARQTLAETPPDLIVFEDQAATEAESPVARFLDAFGYASRRLERPDGSRSTRENFVAERTCR